MPDCQALDYTMKMSVYFSNSKQLVRMAYRFGNTIYLCNYEKKIKKSQHPFKFIEAMPHEK